MTKHIIVFLLSLVLFPCCINCFAQNIDRNVIYDSSDSSIEQDNFYPVSGDTVLRKIQFKPAYDSIKAYRSRREFGYMQYLDSLLKQTKALTIDTNTNNII